MNEENMKTENEERCSVCEKKSTACISFFAHENAMMHKDMDNERMHKTIKVICTTFIAIIVIFVAAYTIRTSIWLNTINKMNDYIVELTRTTGTEVADEAVHQQPD